MEWVGPAVATALGSSLLAALVTGLITYNVQARALDQKKLVETSELFIKLATLAHSRDPSGVRAHVGLGEALAAIHMVAATARGYEPLKPAARAFLRQHLSQHGEKGSDPHPGIAAAAKEALETLD